MNRAVLLLILAVAVMIAISSFTSKGTKTRDAQQSLQLSVSETSIHSLSDLKK